jgi:hypothetical protein
MQPPPETIEIIPPQPPTQIEIEIEIEIEIGCRQGEPCPGH